MDTGKFITETTININGNDVSIKDLIVENQQLKVENKTLKEVNIINSNDYQLKIQQLKDKNKELKGYLKECADLLARNGFGTQVPYYIEQALKP